LIFQPGPKGLPGLPLSGNFLETQTTRETREKTALGLDFPAIQVGAIERKETLNFAIQKSFLVHLRICD
jgi:hypothetical protein